MTPPIQEISLGPGELHFGGGRVRLRTILGSCVSILVWHPVRGLGGMCHFMLPARRTGGQSRDATFGDDAIALMLDAIAKARTRPAEYETRLCGGGNMFPELARQVPKLRAGSDVGLQNVEAGRRLLVEHGFRSAAEHVGGFGHRRISFDLWSGEARLWHAVPCDRGGHDGWDPRPRSR